MGDGAGDGQAVGVEVGVLGQQVERVGNVGAGEGGAIGPRDALAELEGNGLATIRPAVTRGQPTVVVGRVGHRPEPQGLIDQAGGLEVGGGGERVEIGDERRAVPERHSQCAGGQGARSGRRTRRRDADGNEGGAERRRRAQASRGPLMRFRIFQQFIMHFGSLLCGRFSYMCEHGDSGPAYREPRVVPPLLARRSVLCATRSAEAAADGTACLPRSSTSSMAAS